MTSQKKGVFLEKAKKETSLKQDVELFQERHLHSELSKVERRDVSNCRRNGVNSAISAKET